MERTSGILPQLNHDDPSGPSKKLQESKIKAGPMVDCKRRTDKVTGNLTPGRVGEQNDWDRVNGRNTAVESGE